jgi:hypothetical protein
VFLSDSGAIPADARAELEKFDQASEQIIAAWVRRLESNRPTAKLYHYTNDVGLMGILNSGNLWLTDVFDFNDPSELRHGVSIGARILKKKAEAGPPEAKQFSTFFDRFEQDGGIEASAHYLACCFSARGDDLGQWRAYADNGRGFVLEFEAEGLVSSFSRGGGSTFPITYRDNELSDLHARIVEEAYPRISLPRTIRMTKQEMSEYMKLLSTLFSMHVLRAALFFKHEAYSNEEEFRFLELQRGDQPAHGLKFRSRPYALVRYRELDWKTLANSALRRIVIGPAADRVTGLQFARDCLRAFHPDPNRVQVEYSSIPYRAR